RRGRNPPQPPSGHLLPHWGEKDEMRGDTVHGKPRPSKLYHYPPTCPACFCTSTRAGLPLRGGATKRTTARETGRPMKDALSIPVLEDNDNDVELVRRCLSTNYVKFRSQNTQAR